MNHLGRRRLVAATMLIAIVSFVPGLLMSRWFICPTIAFGLAAIVFRVRFHEDFQSPETRGAREFQTTSRASNDREMEEIAKALDDDKGTQALVLNHPLTTLVV